MTPELITQWAREAGLGVAAEVPHNAEMLQAFAAKVAAHEREECALVCDDISDNAWALWRIGYDPLEQGRNVGADHCAGAIRARE